MWRDPAAGIHIFKGVMYTVAGTFFAAAFFLGATFLEVAFLVAATPGLELVVRSARGEGAVTGGIFG